MKNTLKISILSMLVLVFGCSVAFSQHGEGWNLKKLESKLNLTDTQKDQIEKLRLNHQKDMVDLKAKLQKARIESKEVMSKDEFTRNEYLAAQNKMIKLREEIHLAAANHRMDVLDLMNKDQRKILADERIFEKRQKYYLRKGRGECRSDGSRRRQKSRIHW
jgi:Spy/CpxP family protein refolding chaperone